MFAKIKNYVLVILLILGTCFIINKFQSCKPVNSNSTTTVIPLKTFTPDALDNSSVPINQHIIGVIKPTPVVARPWQNTDTHIVISVDSKCDTCSTNYTQVTQITNKLGFYFQPKIYLGYNSDGLTIGYAQGIFRYSRYTLNGLISFPTVGLALAADLTNNFFCFAGGNIKYLTWEDKMKPETYYFSAGQITNIYPVVGIGFNF